MLVFVVQGLWHLTGLFCHKSQAVECLLLTTLYVPNLCTLSVTVF
jgi:hypothetical protein